MRKAVAVLVVLSLPALAAFTSPCRAADVSVAVAANSAAPMREIAAAFEQVSAGLRDAHRFDRLAIANPRLAPASAAALQVLHAL